MNKTVWYWTFPHVSGWMQIQTSGGDAVIRLLTVTPGFDQGGNNPRSSETARARTIP